MSNDEPTTPDSGSDHRLVKWFVCGTNPDGTRWESLHRHNTREAAVSEIDAWGPEMGTMKVMREIYPLNAGLSHGDGSATPTTL